MKLQFTKCLKKLGLKKGDILFIHCDISLIKNFRNFKDMENTCKDLLQAIMSVIGPNGTIAIPTFSYSFCKKKNYDPLNTKSECGFFSEYVRKLNISKSYNDPNLSVSVIGKKTNYLTENPTVNSYGEKSFFARFVKLRGKILNINMDAGTTFVHYFERLLNVSYRKDFNTKGNIILKKKKIKSASSIYLRKNKNSYFANFEKLHEFAIKKKYFKVIKFNLGHFGLISLKNIKKIVNEGYKKDKNFLIYESVY